MVRVPLVGRLDQALGSARSPSGLLVAAGTGLSPSPWRKQYGDWTEGDKNPLEVTVLLLADHINRLTDDRDYATRLIAEALYSIET